MKFNSNKEKGNSGLGIAIKSTINLCEKYQRYRIEWGSNSCNVKIK